MTGIGADPAAIGKTISFRKRTFTIVGVTPPEFWGMQPGTPVDVTLPITVERPHLAESGNWWLQAIVAHLRPGVPESQAQAEADALYQSFLPESQLPAGVIRKYFQRFQKSCRNESKSNQTGSYESQVKYVPAGTWPAYCGPGDGLRS